MIGRAIALNPREPAYHSNLGIALRRLERFDAAIACFRAGDEPDAGRSGSAQQPRHRVERARAGWPMPRPAIAAPSNCGRISPGRTTTSAMSSPRRHSRMRSPSVNDRLISGRTTRRRSSPWVWRCGRTAGRTRRSPPISGRSRCDRIMPGLTTTWVMRCGGWGGWTRRSPPFAGRCRTERGLRRGAQRNPGIALQAGGAGRSGRQLSAGTRTPAGHAGDPQQPGDGAAGTGADGRGGRLLPPGHRGQSGVRRGA